MVCSVYSAQYRTIMTRVDALLQRDILGRYSASGDHRCYLKKKKNSFREYRYIYRTLHRCSPHSEFYSMSLYYLNGVWFTI